MMMNSTINFNGRLATGLCKKLGVAIETKIPGADDLVLSDIKHLSSYNRYKNGINYKPKSFNDNMQSKTYGVFYNHATPEFTTEIKLADTNLDLNSKITDYITSNITDKAEAELLELHKLDTTI